MGNDREIVDAEVFEEHHFALRSDLPVGPQILRVVAEIGRLIGESPDSEGVRVREITVTLERPITQ